MPTKDELKAKYAIENDDFDILTQLPTEEDQKRLGGFLIKLTQGFGPEEWMWKSIWGRVFAVIILLPAVQGTWDYWKPKAIYSYDQISIYLQTFDAQRQKDDSGFIAFTTQDDRQQHTQQGDVPEIWANGTIIVPISGSRMG